MIAFERSTSLVCVKVAFDEALHVGDSRAMIHPRNGDLDRFLVVLEILQMPGPLRLLHLCRGWIRCP
jgi:hypothetical protein